MFDYLATQTGKCLSLAVSGVVAAAPIIAAEVGGGLISVDWEGLIVLLVQAGALGIVALLLLYVMPAERKAQREMFSEMRAAIKEQATAHKEATAVLVAAFERHDVAWREMLSKRGFCPVRDGHENGNI